MTDSSEPHPSKGRYPAVPEPPCPDDRIAQATRRMPRRRRRAVVTAAVVGVIAVAVAVPVTLHYRLGQPLASPSGPFTCPTRMPGHLVIEHRGTNDRMVPPGAVRATGCRYAGLNDGVRPGTLLRAAQEADAHAVASRLNTLPPFDTHGRPVNCPMDDASHGLVGFDYPDGSTVVVRLALSGCSTVTNGSRTAVALAGVGPLGVPDKPAPSPSVTLTPTPTR